MRTDIDVEKGVQWLHSTHANYPTTPAGDAKGRSQRGSTSGSKPPNIDTGMEPEVRG